MSWVFKPKTTEISKSKNFRHFHGKMKWKRNLQRAFEKIQQIFCQTITVSRKMVLYWSMCLASRLTALYNHMCNEYLSTKMCNQLKYGKTSCNYLQKTHEKIFLKHFINLGLSWSTLLYLFKLFKYVGLHGRRVEQKHFTL